MIFLQRNKKLINEIVKFSTYPVRIVSEDPSSLTYEITVQVNSSKAIKFGSTKAELAIGPEPRPLNTMFSVRDGSNASKKILTRNNKILEVYEKNLNSIVANYTIDLTKAIPNTFTRRSKKDRYFKNRVFRYVKKSTLIENSREGETSIISPNPQIPEGIRSLGRRPSRVSRFTKLSGQSSKYKISSIANSTRSPLSNLENSESTLPSLNYAVGSIPSDRVRVDNESYSRFFKNVSNPYTAQTSDNSRVLFSNVFKTRFRKMKFNFTIDKRVIDKHSQFNAVVTLKNTKDQYLGHTKFVIDCSLLSKYQDNRNPIILPSLYAYSKGSKNVITLQNRDRRIKSVSIFRKLIDPNSSSTKVVNSFINIRQIRFSSPNDVKSITDRTSGVHPTIYRAVIDNTLDSLKFVEAIAPARKRITLDYVNEHISFQVKQFSIEGSRKEAIIEVSLSSDGISSIGLQKINKTLFEKEFSYVDSLHPRKMVRSGDSSNTFTHQDIIPGHIYEYRVKLYLRSQVERMSKDKLTWKVPLVPLEKDITTKIVSKSGVGINTKIELNTVSLPKDVDILAKAVEDRNIEESSVDVDLIKSDSSIKVFVYRVTRTDLFTGEVVDFGTIKGNTFLEKDYAQISIGRPVIRGRRYRYDIFTDKVDAQSSGLSTDPMRKREDPLTGTFYNYDTRKSDHPTAVREGLISSRETRMSKLGNNESSYYTTGNPVSYIVGSSVNTMSFKQSTVSPRPFKSSEIRWIIDDPIMIDHFVVKRILPDSQKIISVVHSPDASTNYTTIDRLSGVLLGATVSYEIIAVDQNMNVVQSITTKSLRVA